MTRQGIINKCLITSLNPRLALFSFRFIRVIEILGLVGLLGLTELSWVWFRDKRVDMIIRFIRPIRDIGAVRIITVIQVIRLSGVIRIIGVIKIKRYYHYEN